MFTKLAIGAVLVCVTSLAFYGEPARGQTPTPTPPPGSPSSCEFVNRSPAPDSAVIVPLSTFRVLDGDPVPSFSSLAIGVELQCSREITSVTLRLDGTVWPHQFFAISATRRSIIAAVPASDVSPGIRTVTVEVGVAGQPVSGQWSFRVAIGGACGAPTPNGGAYPPSGIALLVWEATRECPAGHVATDIESMSGKRVDVVWFLDNRAGEWLYYLPAVGIGTLVGVGPIAAVAVILS